MTTWTRNPRDERRCQQAPIAGGKAQMNRDRRHSMVVSAVVLGGASGVLGLVMLTSTAASAAPGAQSSAMAVPGLSQEGGHGSTPSPTMAGDMPGMDHGSAVVPTSSPSPTMAGDMPGMDHGSGHAPASSAPPTSSGDMPGMDHGSGDMPASGTDEHGKTGTDEHGKTGTDEHGKAVEVAVDRPLVPVLGTFGGGASAVLLSAAFLRRRDRAAEQVKLAARAARRSQK